MRIHLLGVPFNGDGTPPEVENPAQALRQLGLAQQLEKNGMVVIDHGDLPIPRAAGCRDAKTGILNFNAWRELTETLARKINRIKVDESFLLLLGGDCSILVGVFAAPAEVGQDTGLVFIDGHGDFHTPQTSPEGEPADMELSVLTGRGPQNIIQAFNPPLLSDKRVVVYGIRSYDGIETSQITVYDSQHMRQSGIRQTVQEGLTSPFMYNRPLWLNFDVDVIDPQFMPVVFPEPGGLTFEETEIVLKEAFDTERVIGMSVTCYHPDLDSNSCAGVRLVDMIASVFSQNHKKNV